MFAVFYIQHDGNHHFDFDAIFRFYRKICFICASRPQLDYTKRQFMEWLNTHDFSIEYSFNLIEDMCPEQHVRIFQV